MRSEKPIIMSITPSLRFLLPEDAVETVARFHLPESDS